MASDDIPAWYTTLALPVLLGFLTATIGAFFGYILDFCDRKKQLRKRELERAMMIHDDIVKSLDRLLNHLKWDAWFIAMRKTKSREYHDGTPDGPWNDKARWILYKKALDNWRSNDLLFTSHVNTYFPERFIDGVSVSPSLMIIEITNLINDAALNVWNLNWEGKFRTSSTCTSASNVPKPSQDPHVAVDINAISGDKNEFEVMAKNNKPEIRTQELIDLTEDEKKGKKYFNELLVKVDGVCVRLSTIMTRDIQEGNVGKLRKDFKKFKFKNLHEKDKTT